MRGFLWELYGAFDLMLMWSNDHFGLGIPDKNVVPDSILAATPTKNLTDWPRVQKLLETAWLSEWLFELRMYRNFSHRSFLLVQGFIPKQGQASMMLPRAREGQPYVPVLPEALRPYIAEMASLGAALFS